MKLPKEVRNDLNERFGVEENFLESMLKVAVIQGVGEYS